MNSSSSWQRSARSTGSAAREPGAVVNPATWRARVACASASQDQSLHAIAACRSPAPGCGCLRLRFPPFLSEEGWHGAGRRRHRRHRRCRCCRRRCRRLQRCRRYLGWPSSSIGQAPDRLHGHEGTSGAGLLQLADEGRQPRLAPCSRPGDAIDLLEERARLDHEFARAKPAEGVHVVLQRRGSGGARGAGWGAAKGERGARRTGAKSSAPRRRLECVRGEAGRSVPVPAQLPHLLDKLDRLLVYAHDRPESILAILVVHACCPEDRLVPAVHGRRQENHGWARHIANQVSTVHRRGGCT